MSSSRTIILIIFDDTNWNSKIFSITILFSWNNQWNIIRNKSDWVCSLQIRIWVLLPKTYSSETTNGWHRGKISLIFKIDVDSTNFFRFFHVEFYGLILYMSKKKNSIYDERFLKLMQLSDFDILLLFLLLFSYKLRLIIFVSRMEKLLFLWYTKKIIMKISKKMNLNDNCLGFYLSKCVDCFFDNMK